MKNNKILQFEEFLLENEFRNIGVDEPVNEASLVKGVYKLWPDIDEEELSPAQKGYQELMTVALLKFGAETPADLDTAGKKDLFNWLKDNWNKDKAEASKEGKELIKKAKDKGLMGDEPTAAKSKEEQEKDKAEKAKKKREEIAKKLDL